VKLDAFDFVAAVAEAMMMPSSVSAVMVNSRGNDFFRRSENGSAWL